MMTKEERVANVIRRQLIEKRQIDSCSSLLCEDSDNRHIDVTSEAFTFTFLCKKDSIFWCPVAVKEGEYDKAYRKEIGGGDPLDHLNEQEKQDINKLMKIAGCKASIKVKQYWVVTLNGCAVGNFWNSGPMNGVIFPDALRTNGFDNQKEAQAAAEGFKAYYHELQECKARRDKPRAKKKTYRLKRSVHQGRRGLQS